MSQARARPPGERFATATGRRQSSRDYARYSIGRAEASESIDLNEAAREVIALSSADLQEGRVFLRTVLAPDLPTVTGDRVQLQQVILNFLRNGMDAMTAVADRPKAMMIRTSREPDGGVRVVVQDAGTGFDPGATDRLFEAFYTTKAAGMGMGLSVSRTIIERHQGRLWASHNDGPGSTFAFSIPRGLEPAASQSASNGAIPYDTIVQ